MTNSIDEIRDADCIFVTGSNTTESHPVISYEVVRAATRAPSLIVADPRRSPMVEHASLLLQPAGHGRRIFLAMMHVILARAGPTRRSSPSAPRASRSSRQCCRYTPEVAAQNTACRPRDRARGSALRAGPAAATSGRGIRFELRIRPAAGRSSILYAMGITQHTTGTDNVLSLANLAMLTRQLGKPATGVNPLRGQNNVQGACDLGALPNVYPATRRWTTASAGSCRRLGRGRPRRRAGPDRGRDDARRGDGRVRAMYIMGENPMLCDPNMTHVEEALRDLDFLVVQDIFLTETAQLADVVLPAAASLEKDGTFTNTERRVQLPPPHCVAARRGPARLADHLALGDDWRRNLGSGGGSRWRFTRPRPSWRKRQGTPIYGGIARALGREGLIWPCPTLDHPGTPILHTEQFSRGLGKFHPVGPSCRPRSPTRSSR